MTSPRLFDASSPVTLDDLFDRRPRFAEAFVAAYVHAVERNDPVLVELCRLRMASLLRSPLGTFLRSRAAIVAGLHESKIAELSNWPSSELFDDRERICLGFAELFVMDSAGVGDSDVERLLLHLAPDEVLWFITAINYIDGLERLCALFDVAPVESAKYLPMLTTADAR